MKYYTSSIFLGYIPKGQHYYGERYAGFTQNAIAHMEDAQQNYDQQQQKLRSQIRSQYEENTGSSVRCHKTPLKPIIEKTKMYFPKGKQHSLSPYTYNNADPRKYMMSGYTGFVPCSRGLIGKRWRSFRSILCLFSCTINWRTQEK